MVARVLCILEFQCLCDLFAGYVRGFPKEVG